MTKCQKCQNGPAMATHFESYAFRTGYFRPNYFRGRTLISLIARGPKPNFTDATRCQEKVNFEPLIWLIFYLKKLGCNCSPSTAFESVLGHFNHHSWGTQSPCKRSLVHFCACFACVELHQSHCKNNNRIDR